MSTRPAQRSSSGAAFRLKLLVAMMIVVAAITGLGLYIEQRNLAAAAARTLQQQFDQQLATLHNIQEVRHAALAERCRALVSKPRIHAALEDNALDLLYPSARDELRDVMEQNRSETHTLHAEFYRFLDSEGRVIPAGDIADVGPLNASEEATLALRTTPREQQLGYVVRSMPNAGEAVAEVIAMPIFSSESGEPIAALALGFKPIDLGKRSGAEMKSGIWINARVYLAGLPDAARGLIEQQITRVIQSGDQISDRFHITIGNDPHLLFFKRLNAGSLYPLACEVCLFPLADLQARQRQVRWQILTAGAMMILAGFLASHFAAGRLSKPVEKLARDSEVNREQRQRAETALEQTNVELQRSVRFSADASHQLKTPVTVLRAGLEELLTRESLANEAREEISQLVHQTYRLNGVIEDLLLLSRMDAGRLQLSVTSIDLSQLVEAELDDLAAQSDDFNITIDANVPPGIVIAGERRYTTMVVRNLLENARKYNRPGGTIRVAARQDGEFAFLNIGNAGPSIPAGAQEHIFERFHRGAAGENIPGHGLGLNLARELARLHGGDVRLVRSEDNWTEFEICFRIFKADDGEKIT